MLTPAGYVTGGPEALHQLVHKATVLGYDASVVYFPADHPDPTADVYRCYAAPVAPAVVDAADSLVVVPETEVPRLLDLGAAQRGLWWLSVDNFVSRNEALRQQVQSAAPPLDLVYDTRSRCIHLAQSDYARQHLKSRGAGSLTLTDYIRSEIVEQSQQVRGGPKDDIVVYNAKKGMEFTEQLMAASSPAIEWVPLQNLTPSQVTGLLGRAKAYVDFGNHPGRDRIPREAALCGCCVLTGSRGSAGNPVDLPIPAAYRFEDADPATPGRVLERIEDVFKDYRTHADRFADYRGWIEGQEQAFTHEVFTALSTVEGHLRRTQRFSL